MTERWLIEIKRNVMDDVSPLMDELILLAMKQAVNEALDEAANNADIICANAKKGSDTCGAWCGGCDSAIVNKQTILNLKVK